jgi:tripartite-type tricarboxylate transporter receptor subunit TctC
MDFLANLEGLGRLLMAPPGIPAARLAFLREAVKATLHNPQLIAEGERMERIIEYTDPEATLRTVTAVVSDVSPEQKTRALKLLSGEK